MPLPLQLLALLTWSCWCGHGVLGMSTARAAAPASLKSSSMFSSSQRGVPPAPPNALPSGAGSGGPRPRNGGLGVPMSPCPAVFRYERRGGGWVGVVTVPAPPTDMPLVLRVDLAIRAALTTVS